MHLNRREFHCCPFSSLSLVSRHFRAAEPECCPGALMRSELTSNSLEFGCPLLEAAFPVGGMGMGQGWKALEGRGLR